ncbi:MAG: tRNA (adenosine(37)-N6)-threonylcarbamoyltransferase complex dimerization subunit type 1 TsaB [Saccharofermentanales bacterium]
MIILASDTTTRSISVAILREGNILFSRTDETGSVHSQTLMPMILEALETAGLKFADIGLYACTAGPGSYTGIRINIATIKAIAYASGRGATGVSTLAVLACPHRADDSIVCPLIDARNRRAFAAAYLGAASVMEEGNYPMEEIMAKITGSLGPSVRRVVFCGDAAVKYGADPQVLEAVAGMQRLYPDVSVGFLSSVPQAADAARIALSESLDSPGHLQQDPFLLEARYISPSQAERMKSKNRADPKFAIRDAQASDVAGLHQLETECFAIPWTEESLRRDIVENDFARYFIASVDGRIAGYIGLYYSFEDAQITNLAVKSDLRGKGIGHMLVKRALNFCASKGCERVTLEVRTGNSRAIALYTAEGFGMEGIRKGYYADNGEDAIIMLKNLVKI